MEGGGWRAPGEARRPPSRRRPATGRAGLDQLRPLAEQLLTGPQQALA
ncbi:hypothetical protein [Prauserella flavalba]|nr:hypothetical protein [Prauserella flavalba]